MVSQLVGKNYKKGVYTDKYDVITIIYHDMNDALSTRALKIASVLAKVFSENEYIRFTKINARLNSDELIPQNGYPYIRMFKKEVISPDFESYDGFYSAKDLAEWISEKLGIENPFDEFMEKMRREKEEKKKRREN